MGPPADLEEHHVVGCALTEIDRIITDLSTDLPDR